MEEEGQIKREVFPEVPLWVEYSITEFGITLIPVLDAISNWGRNFWESDGKLIEVKT